MSKRYDKFLKIIITIVIVFMCISRLQSQGNENYHKNNSLQLEIWVFTTYYDAVTERPQYYDPAAMYNMGLGLNPFNIKYLRSQRLNRENENLLLFASVGFSYFRINKTALQFPLEVGVRMGSKNCFSTSFGYTGTYGKPLFASKVGSKYYYFNYYYNFTLNFAYDHHFKKIPFSLGVNFTKNFLNYYIGNKLIDGKKMKDYEDYKIYLDFFKPFTGDLTLAYHF